MDITEQLKFTSQINVDKIGINNKLSRNPTQSTRIVLSEVNIIVLHKT